MDVAAAGIGGILFSCCVEVDTFPVAGRLEIAVYPSRQPTGKEVLKMVYRLHMQPSEGKIQILPLAEDQDPDAVLAILSDASRRNEPVVVHAQRGGKEFDATVNVPALTYWFIDEFDGQKVRAL